MKIAYVVSDLAAVLEILTLTEIIALKERGHDLHLVPLASADGHPVRAGEEAFPGTAIRTPRWTTASARLLRGLVLRPVELLAIAAEMTIGSLGRPIALGRCLALIPRCLWLSERLRGVGVEHLHALGAVGPATAAWIIHRLAGMPYSIAGEAHEITSSNRLLETTIPDAAFYAAGSEFNRALIIQRMGPSVLNRVRLVRRGFPRAGIPFDRDGRWTVNRTPCVVSAGRLGADNGFDVLIRACGRLRERGLRFRCVIMGDGPERARLESLATSLGLERDLTLEGDRSTTERREIMARADLFALARVDTPDGGIPPVMMEAMALGVPVICSRLPEFHELVVDGRTGILVAPGDDRHLADGIERLLADVPLAARLRLAAREMIEKEFDPGRWADLLSVEFAAARAAAGKGRP